MEWLGRTMGVLIAASVFACGGETDGESGASDPRCDVGQDAHAVTKLQGSLPEQLQVQPEARFEVGISITEPEAMPCVEAAIERTGGTVLEIQPARVLFAELSRDGIMSLAGRADVMGISLNRDPEAPPLP